ncbi:peroxin 14/17 [Cladophialophora carrionii]|uniref:Peroxisomal membrane protein PEX14 n=1 Tax=Cladophialophora carrionii TaxID=86049 RepID=A0A1C1D0C8_9EURO|nr:peroxin 14/17 [Cladophialophora carrionii]
MSDQDSRKAPAIPAWQQSWQSSTKEQTTPSGDQSSTEQSTTQPSLPSEPPLLEQAQKSLEDESIRDASRESKVEFLQKKGLQPDEIEKLLGPEPAVSSTATDEASELKTIHDTSSSPGIREQEQAVSSPSSPPPASASAPRIEPAPTPSAKRDVPPIITYPEFLLKPQKPPPLVTFDRLANAAYVLAGVSALTWGASKYLIQPMLESLTEARHSLAETAEADLETLNTKLESTVSHVPYIPSVSALHSQQQKPKDDDQESTDSDPTELFHRDIATQTSPHPTHTTSLWSDDDDALPAQDPTTSQSSRLRSLHSTLSSLLSSQTTHFSQDRLKESMSDFQSTLDKLEASYNPFQVDYTSSFSSYSGPGAGDKSNGDKSAKKEASEATKFKNEIRALKGAFLSSRNFPTARPAQPFMLPPR